MKLHCPLCGGELVLSDRQVARRQTGQDEFLITAVNQKAKCAACNKLGVAFTNPAGISVAMFLPRELTESDTLTKPEMSTC